MRLVPVAALAALVSFATSASATVVTSTYTLTPAGGGINQLSISVLGLINLDIDASGTIVGSPDIAGSNGPVTAADIDSGAVVTTPINFFSPYLGSITSTPLGINVETPNAPVLTGGGGTFDASEVLFTLNSGVIDALLPAFAVNASIDLSTDPISAAGNGTATWVNTGPDTYQVDVPINFVTVLDPNGLGITVVLLGTVQAVGTAVIPEPTSGLFLASLACGVGAVVRRRRS